MRKTSLADMTVDQLVMRFGELTLKQFHSIENGRNVEFSRLYSEMLEVEGALKRREGDARRGLVPFLRHPNAQVRLQSAFALLKLEHVAARATLQRLADSNFFPQAADAYGMLMALDEGRYVPE